jgi:hypothetical protein
MKAPKDIRSDLGGTLDAEGAPVFSGVDRLLTMSA